MENILINSMQNFKICNDSGCFCDMWSKLIKEDIESQQTIAI